MLSWAVMAAGLVESCPSEPEPRPRFWAWLLGQLWTVEWRAASWWHSEGGLAEAEDSQYHPAGRPCGWQVCLMWEGPRAGGSHPTREPSPGDPRPESLATCWVVWA
jgi:hypothetical protein